MPKFTDLFKRTPKKSVQRKYEGASRKGRLGRWWAPNSDQDTETARDLPTLRNRCRDLRRNNAYANRATTVISSNVVGTGVVTQFRKESDASKDIDPRIEQLWKKWAHTHNFDFDERLNVYSFQRLIMEAQVESGEILIRKKFDAKKDIPLQYQILEPDFIATIKDGEQLRNGGRIIQGVEFNSKGKRVALHMYKDHPGAYLGSLGSLATDIDTVRIPIDEVYQIFKTVRPGQTRGVPWLAPVMVRLKDLDEYEDAQLYKQKIASCFVAFVRDLSADFKDEDPTCGEDLSGRLEPGLIEELPPGKGVDFANPPIVDGYKDYVNTILHSISAGMGVSYESLTGDLQEVNFSSGRMGWLEMGRNIRTWRNELISNQFLDLVAQDFLNTLSVMGIDTNGVTWVHTPPRREMIDPVKETAAIKDMIRTGLTTLTDELMAQGKDPEDHFVQMQKDFQKLDELNLVLDSDPRKTAGTGKAQDKNEGGVSENTQD